MSAVNSRRIVVGIDFSDSSEVAARQALEIARHVGGELILLHAGATVELPRLDFEANETTRRIHESYRGRLAEELAAHRERLGEMRERFEGQGVIISHMVAEGFPDDALCAAAGDLSADLVVLGTHGRTGLDWFLLGSVASRVVRMAPSDVLVARREGAGRGGYRRTLVATDLTETSLRALDRALELSAADGRIDVAHFYYVGPAIGWGEGSYGFGADFEASVAREIRTEVERVIESRRRRGGPRIELLVLPGAPIPSIVHRLEQEPYDLAALGSHGRRGVRRAILGSVAEAVVRRAPCSVLVARGR